jgi:hypothetical protein
MNVTSRKKLPLAPFGTLCPAPHDVDAAPQLVVVALADAALLALVRALDLAHPILATNERCAPPLPELTQTERCALEIVDVAELLAEAFERYDMSVACDIGHSLDGFEDDFF